MRRLLSTLAALALASSLLGCAEEEAPAITPIRTSGSRAPVAEEPSPLLVQPHLRRTEGGPQDAPAPARTGGGGGSADWRPRLEPQPSAREVEAMRGRLGEEIEERVDPEDDPCDQFRDVMRAAGEATEGPGQDTPEVPSRAAMRENCRQLPAAYRQCLSPEYFREHLDECNAEIARMARRGERRRDSAQRQLDAIRAGREPWPGQRPSEQRPRTSIEEEEEAREGGG